MKTINYTRYLGLVAAFLLTLGLAGRAAAQSSLSLLESAHATLASADHDYKGHRVEAMHQIEAALRTSVAVRHGRHVHIVHYSRPTVTRGYHSKGEPESQAASDEKLRNAQSVLESALAGLSGNQLEHINAAIAHLNTALSVK